MQTISCNFLCISISFVGGCGLLCCCCFSLYVRFNLDSLEMNDSVFMQHSFSLFYFKDVCYITLTSIYHEKSRKISKYLSRWRPKYWRSCCVHRETDLHPLHNEHFFSQEIVQLCWFSLMTQPRCDREMLSHCSLFLNNLCVDFICSGLKTRYKLCLRNSGNIEYLNNTS